MSRRRLMYIPRFALLGLFLFSVFASCLVFMPAKKAQAAPPCDGSANGRNLCFGYFYNGFYPGPQHNLYGPPPGPGLQVDDVWSFINTLGGRLACLDAGTPTGRFSKPQNDQNATSAAFTVLTMLGAPPGTPKNNACIRWNEWVNIVLTYYDAGLIRFHYAYYSNGINTRSSLDDVEYYSSFVTADSIVFLNPQNNGQVLYGIKRDCGNPVGVLQGLTLNYNLVPAISPLVNGAISTQAEPGDSISFQYGITNTGTTRSPVVNCNGGALNRAGFHSPSAPAEGGGVALILACPNSFNPGSNYAGGPEIAFTAVANMSYCRTLFVSPVSQSNGGTASIEVCINVVSKPYMKVYGGDISAGNGLETALNSNSCATNNNAAIVAWNKGTAGGYSGAGAQYAAQTVAGITDFASAQGNVAGSAPVPTGLSFANTSTNVGAGNFGGSYGSATCIKNYYGERALLGALPNISALAAGTGTYESTTSATMGARTLGTGDRWTIYINGDLSITGNITFTTVGLTAANMPFLKIVARGNIYIGSGVSQLDGVYIAQANGASGGNIYTCATGAPLTAPTLASGSFYAPCSASKLTVNGALIGNSIEFDRTRGTLRGATVGEASGSANISEVFNFGPAFWMIQPAQGTGRVDNYDAITSLPPVL